MSDFVPCDILPDLWEEILRRHWSFLETEESIRKLEERKKLDVCLKEFLCVVPHDRKFFLPETGHVLRKTIRELPDFTAHKAMLGFEAISQYANNLFTKPWRKEFRVLKTYSGPFQHEIKSNLLDADQLFIAMGYRRTAEDTFVLEGPICPDQVTNVSRDAMAAYMECQIMKHIYAGIAAAGFTCSWQDIYSYRERHAGGTTQSVKELVYRLHEKRQRKEKLLRNENTYSNVPSNVRCDKCAPYHHQQQHTKSSAGAMAAATACALHGNAHVSLNANPCALHPNGPPANLLYNEGGKYSAQQQHAGGTAMTHSRSLEHYNEPHAALPHRHSFDHQQQGCMAAQHHLAAAGGPSAAHPHLYETPYDCLDAGSLGSSNVSYAAVAPSSAYAHPYNAPGNRYPLPYNISNQLNAQYSTPADSYGNVEQNIYASIGKSGSGTAAAAHSCNYHAGQPSQSAMHYRQNTYPPDHHLIDFDDRAQLAKHDFGAHDYDVRDVRDVRALYEQPRSSNMRAYGYDGYEVPAAYLPTTLPHLQQQQQLLQQPDNYIYARPVPKSSRLRHEAGSTTDKYARQQDALDNNRKMQKELIERANQRAPTLEGRRGQRRLSATNNEQRDTSDGTSFESASLDDFAMRNSSPPLMPKVQEGVGSFESWNYVFKNLERSGYSKDLGDREDLLVQSLDLDSLNLSNGLNNTTEKRRSTNVDSKSTRAAQSNGEKSRTLEKPSSSSKREPKASSTAITTERAGLTPAKTKATIIEPTSSAPNNSSSNVGGGVRKVKSALKTATVDFKPGNSKSATMGRSRSSNGGAVAKQPPPVSTQLIVTSPNEWSCRFCTFLNPDTKRICEMCCRSKEFNLEAAASVTHASSTCV